MQDVHCSIQVIAIQDDGVISLLMQFFVGALRAGGDAHVDAVGLQHAAEGRDCGLVFADDEGF